MHTPTIFIVTPSFNAAATIERTILSVVHQAGNFNIRYHIQDGGSTDGTVDLLKKWERKIAHKEVTLLCKGVEFSYQSAPDKGMYAAIFQAFSHMAGNPDDWLAWINADDMLSPGALTLLETVDCQLADKKVAWVGGATSMVWDNLIVGWGDRPVNSEILADGLCDGEHWTFLQQEGTFFRRWLWEKAEPHKTFAAFKYAGDWNLWRVMAKSAKFYQVKWPMGSFVRREGQISQKHRDKYVAEMERVIPRELRLSRFAGLKEKKLHRDMLVTKYTDRTLQVTRELISLQPWLEKIDKAEKKMLASMGFRPFSEEPAVKVEQNLVAYDAEWQYPAITEQHAYQQAIKLLPPVDGVVYFAFPWATLIDLLQTNNSRAAVLRARLLSFKEVLSSYKRVVTVCQHIFTAKYIELLESVGVTDVFWTHATVGLKQLGKRAPMHVYPFPLYPVQAPQPPKENPATARKHLFSFIGAKPSAVYLTNVRSLIIDLLADDPRGFVRSRDSWHYEKVVYDHQIHGREKKTEDLVNRDWSEEFQDLLLDSTFTLCPSGSGPNSIRLWEAIGAGSIPVILADTYQPPGNPALWAAAAVVCKENAEAVKALPDKLAAIAKDGDALKSMRAALRQIWLLYGPEGFVHDIQELYIKIQAELGYQRSMRNDGHHGLGCDYIAVLAAELSNGHATPEQRRLFIMGCTSRILLDAAGFARACAAQPQIAAMLGKEIKSAGDAEAVLCRNAVVRRSNEMSGLKELLA